MVRRQRMVQRVITPQPVMEGAGVKLRRSIATRELDSLDPFLLFDDFSSPDSADHIRGFPWHPHRGIETVTYVLKGEILHRDSLGNQGTIGRDQVQWMSSGSGIMHEEMPRESEGGLIGFQLWVNLPARHKMSTPRYRDIRADEIAVLTPRSGVTIKIIAGSYEGRQGPVVDIAAGPAYFDIMLEPERETLVPVDPAKNACAYLFEGTADFGSLDGPPDSGEDARIESPHLVLFGEGDGVRVVAGPAGARFLLLAGTPLEEPVARYGPFVMNTREEIEEALRDLRNGTFIREKPTGIE
jgi:quercetin 2,3-dioxygenase